MPRDAQQGFGRALIRRLYWAMAFDSDPELERRLRMEWERGRNVGRNQLEEEQLAQRLAEDRAARGMVPS